MLDDLQAANNVATSVRWNFTALDRNGVGNFVLTEKSEKKEAARSK